MSVSRADHEPAFTHAIVAPTFEDSGEFLGAEVLALFVQQDGLAGCLRFGNTPAGFGQFGELQRPLDAFRIALDQLFLGRAGDLATG